MRLDQSITEEQILEALQDKDKLKKFVWRFTCLTALTQAILPKYSEEIFQKILHDDGLFQDIIRSGMIMHEMTELFPGSRKSIVEKTKILTDIKALVRFCGSSNQMAGFHFPAVLAACLPDQAEILIKRILKDPALFDRYITDHSIVQRYYPSASSAIQAATSVAELRAVVKNEMLEKNKEAAFAKLTALDRGRFFHGAEPSNTGKNPNERRTSHLLPELKKTIAEEHFGPKKK